MLDKSSIQHLSFRYEAVLPTCLKLLEWDGGTIHQVYEEYLKGCEMVNPWHPPRKVCLFLDGLASEEFSV